jgi:hypothetical protein
MMVTYVQVFCCRIWEKPRIIFVTKAAIRCPLIFFHISDDNSTAPEDDNDDDDDNNNNHNNKNVIFYSFICMFWVIISFVVCMRFFLLYHCHWQAGSQKCEATISFVTSVCPSVRQHRTARLPLDGFSWNLIFEYFFKKKLYRTVFKLH